MFTNTENFYRNRPEDLDAIALDFDSRLMKSFMTIPMIGLDPQAEFLFSMTSEGSNEWDLISRKYYFSGEGLVKAGLADEAPLIQGATAYSTKSVEMQARHGRALLTRTELKFPDLRMKAFGMIDGTLKTAINVLWNNISQAMADIVSRGFESAAYKNAFGDMVQFRDPEGSSPIFAYNHKITSDSSYIYNNLCIEELSNGNIILNPPLSPEAIMHTHNYARRVRDFAGIPFGSTRNIDTVITSDLESILALWQINTSEYEPHTANNGKNVFRLYFKNGIKLFSWDRLSYDGQNNEVSPVTGARYAKQWFMVDSTKVRDGFKFQMVESPVIKKELQIGNSENMAYYVRTLFRIWVDDVTGIFGSNGTATVAPADFPKF